MRSLAFVVAAVVPLVSMTASLRAQTTVPLSGEAKHHLVFENSHTRVYDVVVPAGDSTLYHVHANDYVYVTLGKASLEAQGLGAAQTKLDLADGEVRYTKGPITHRVLNPSNTAFHNLTIEVLEPAGVTLAPASPGDVALENDRVRAVRIVLAPGQRTPRHDHRGPWLEVAVKPGTVSVDDGTGPPRRETLAPAKYAWHAAGTSHLITNVGNSRVELVEIDWK